MEHKTYWKGDHVSRSGSTTSPSRRTSSSSCSRSRSCSASRRREGDLDADVPRRAQPDPLAPRLARHVGARDRRDLDVLVRVPRAGHDARPVRDGHRRPHAHALLPGRRARRGHPGGLLRAGARLRARTCRGRSTTTRALLDRNKIWLERTKGIGLLSADGRARARPVGPDAARLRRRLGPAQGDAVPRLRRGRLRRARVPERRRLRPLQGAHGRDAPVGAHRRPVRRPARGAARRSRGSPTTARSCCRRARSSTPRWSR